jgi:hypothetical protein
VLLSLIFAYWVQGSGFRVQGSTKHKEIEWGCQEQGGAEAEIRIFCLTAEPGSFRRVCMKLTLHAKLKIKEYWWWHNFLKEACLP